MSVYPPDFNMLYVCQRIHCDTGVGVPSGDYVSPSLLESLEDSTSSSDVPKSKLDQV